MVPNRTVRAALTSDARDLRMINQGNERRLGWLGTGRMGFELARRLLAAGCDVAVYNRTKSKAEALG